jgi:hypothetical protein
MTKLFEDDETGANNCDQSSEKEKKAESKEAPSEFKKTFDEKNQTSNKIGTVRLTKSLEDLVEVNETKDMNIEEV